MDVTHYNVVIIDTGISNSSSILNMLKYIGIPAIRSNKKDDLSDATHLILPGVGAYDKGINSLKSNHLLNCIYKACDKGIPLLGICLGMHLLFDGSEEGDENGLGLISGSVKKFKFKDDTLKIPHMGWNYVIPCINSRYFKKKESELDRFYFVHSYYVLCNNHENIIAKTNYGYEFTSAVRKNNILGVQFHPEKSHKYGIRFFKEYFNNNDK